MLSAGAAVSQAPNVSVFYSLKGINVPERREVGPRGGLPREAQGDGEGVSIPSSHRPAGGKQALSWAGDGMSGTSLR